MRAARSNAAHQRDAQLVQRHRAGELAAFAELYELHHPRLLRYVRRQVREDHIAEDLAHDTFAAALAGSANLRDPSRFYPWLVGIARVLVVRHYRAAGQTSQLTDVAFADDAPELALLRRVDHDNVATALGRVGDRYQEVLRLHEHEELSYGDIAERLGLSPSIVKVLMHRARRALRREYLAVTEPERTAALIPVLYGAAASLRRLRDRFLQIAAQVPNNATVTASMAAAAIGVASLLSPAPSGTGTAWGEGVRGGSPGLAAAAVSGRDAETPSRPSAPARVSGGRPTSGDVASVASYQPNVTFNRNDEREWRQRHEHMPYQQGFGPVWIGVDPETMRRDVGSALAGDYSWMED